MSGWEVYENTGEGFARSPTSWSLPNLFPGQEWLSDLSQDTTCDSSNLVVSLVDMDGDEMTRVIWGWIKERVSCCLTFKLNIYLAHQPICRSQNRVL